MNREQAETLLAALVADELDEPVRGALLAYLKTDPVLSERLGDMRLAAGLLREGLEQASADVPAALEASQRAELLALIEREPISATIAGDFTQGPARKRQGPLFRFRIADAVAACAALGIALVGLMPGLGDARRTARRMQNNTQGYADFSTYGAYEAADDLVPEAALPELSLSDRPMPGVDGTLGIVRSDSIDFAGGTRITTADGRTAGQLIDEAFGTLALGRDRSADPVDYALRGGETNWKESPAVTKSEDVTRSRHDRPSDPAAPEQTRADQRRSADTGLASMIDGKMPPSPPELKTLAGDTLVQAGKKMDGLALGERENFSNTPAFDKPDVLPSPEPPLEHLFSADRREERPGLQKGNIVGVEGTAYDWPDDAEDPASTGIRQATPLAKDWAGSTVWNDNKVGYEKEIAFDTRFALGSTNGSSGSGDASGLFADRDAVRDVFKLDKQSGQQGKQYAQQSQHDGQQGQQQAQQGAFQYGGLAGNKGLNDSLPGYRNDRGGVDGEWGRGPIGGQLTPEEQKQITVDRNTTANQIAARDNESKSEQIAKQAELIQEQLDQIAELSKQRAELSQSLIDARSQTRRLSDNYLRTQEENKAFEQQLKESITREEAIPDSAGIPGPRANTGSELAEATEKLAQLKCAIEEEDEKNAPVNDLIAKARANTAAEKAEQGDKMLRTGQLNAAVQLYEDATLLDPDNLTNQAKLAEAKAKLNEQMKPLGVLDQTGIDRKVRYQTTVSEYEKAMAKTNEALLKQDFLAASNAAVEARTILSRDKAYFNSDDYDARVNRANQLQSQIDSTKSLVEANQLKSIEADRARREANISKQTEGRKIEEIQAHLRKARELQLEKRYDESLSELDAALFLDPENVVVKGLRDMMQDTAYAVESFELKRANDLGIAQQTLLNIEASTPFDDILTYPGEWPELTALRLRGLEDDPATAQANEASRAAMRRDVVFNAKQASLESVINHIRDSTGANVAVNWNALELVGVDKDSLVTISPGRASAEQLLGIVLDQVSADTFDGQDKPGFSVSEGVVKISTLRDLQADTETIVYDIGAVLNRTPESGRQQRVAEIIEAIKTKIGEPTQWSDEEYSIHALNGNLIVRTTTAGHRDLARLIGELSAEAESDTQASSSVIPPVNPWVLTEQDAQSTFALDTDTASYELARRTIREQAQLPPVASVRMEEFVNRFDYQYPTGRVAHDTFTVHAEAGPAPFAGSAGGEAVLLKVGVRGRVVARDQLKPAHYVFVIDASGSMAREDRLPLVRQSLAMLLGQLGEQDTVSLVSYETRPYLLLEHASASDAQTIMKAAATIQTGGSTNLTDGLKLGYQVASKHFKAGGVNRVILCSDGVANVGNDDAKQMLDAVNTYRQHGVTLMTVGVGVDGQTAGQAAAGAERFNDGLMEQLANRGDGQYVYLGSAEDAQRQFVEDLAATRPTIAYDAKIQMDFDTSRVRRYRLVGYENRAIADQDFRNDAVDAGEVGSGQSATALYEVELWPLRDNRVAVQNREQAGSLGTVYVRYRDARSGTVEETATALPLGIVRDRTVAEDPRFYLAACAAEFAELLRNSEHAADGSYDRLYRIAREVAEALPLDQDAAELAELIGRAQGLPRAGQ